MSDSMTMTSVKEPQSEVGKARRSQNMVWIRAALFSWDRISTIRKSAGARSDGRGVLMDRHRSPNEEFSQIRRSDKHVTSAERAPKAEDYPGAKPELLVPASVVFQQTTPAVESDRLLHGWIYVPERTGATEGPQVRKGRAKHPCDVAYGTLKPTLNGSAKITNGSRVGVRARGGLNGASLSGR